MLLRRGLRCLVLGVLALNSVMAACNHNAMLYNVNQTTHCLSLRNTTHRLDSIVGIGWDSLRGVMTLPIMDYTYDNCYYTEDNKYIIPDNIVAIPVFDVKFNQVAQMYSSFESFSKSHTDTESESVSASADGLGGSESFSHSNTEAKRSSHSSSKKIFSMKLEYQAATLIVDINKIPGKGFINRVKKLINVSDSERADIAGRLVLDYGTDVIVKAKLGASVQMLSYFTASKDENSESKSSQNNASVSATGAFAGVSFGGGVAGSLGSNSTNSHGNSTSFSDRTTRSKGGPGINTLLTGNSNMTMENLIGYDYRVMPLSSLVNLMTLNNSLYETFYVMNDILKWEHEVHLIKQAIDNAVKDYYSNNTIRGCTNPDYPDSYNFQVNLPEENACQEDLGIRLGKDDITVTAIDETTYYELKFIHDNFNDNMYAHEKSTNGCHYISDNLTDLCNDDKSRLVGKLTKNIMRNNLPYHKNSDAVKQWMNAAPIKLTDSANTTDYIYYSLDNVSCGPDYEMELYQIEEGYNNATYYSPTLDNVMNYTLHFVCLGIERLNYSKAYPVHRNELFYLGTSEPNNTSDDDQNIKTGNYMSNLGIYITPNLFVDAGYGLKKQDRLPFGGIVSTCGTRKTCIDGFVPKYLKSFGGCNIYVCDKIKKVIDYTPAILKRYPYQPLPANA